MPPQQARRHAISRNQNMKEVVLTVARHARQFTTYTGAQREGIAMEEYDYTQNSQRQQNGEVETRRPMPAAAIR